MYEIPQFIDSQWNAGNFSLSSDVRTCSYFVESHYMTGFHTFGVGKMRKLCPPQVWGYAPMKNSENHNNTAASKRLNKLITCLY